MARPISVLEVTPEEKRELARRVAASTTSARDCLRAHIVLLRSEGVGQQEVASRLGVSARSVSKWSQRLDREGLDGLKDQPGRGPKPSIPLATVRRVVEEAGKAPPGRQRWSTRSLAQEVGISADSVALIWQSQGRQGLEPHRLRHGPCAEIREGVGLEGAPPLKAVLGAAPAGALLLQHLRGGLLEGRPRPDACILLESQQIPHPPRHWFRRPYRQPSILQSIKTESSDSSDDLA